MTAVMYAANEVAVEAFLNGHIGFLDIAEITDHCLASARPEGRSTELEAVLAADALSREAARDRITRLGR